MDTKLKCEERVQRAASHLSRWNVDGMRWCNCGNKAVAKVKRSGNLVCKKHAAEYKEVEPLSANSGDSQ